MLELDAEELNTCVACGLCLPHCPTFRATGEEALSPRGRIDAMRAVELRNAPIDDDFVRFMETCVQCRGCEPACPSGVPFGSLMEGTRAHLAGSGRITPWWQRAGLRMLRHHRVVLAGSSLLAALQRTRLVPSRIGVPPLPLRRPPAVASTGAETWLFTGCVMDAWFRDTHRATARVLDALDVGYRTPRTGGSCCGALHVHAGLHDDAVAMAEAVIASMPGEAPIVVNSAGCGAVLKEYGALLGTDDAHRFASRVVDVSEFVAPRLGDLPGPVEHFGPVVVQDPCHLRHVQRAHEPVRRVVGAVADVVELDDDGLCCGAGGAFSALQPELAGAIRERKMAAVERAVERSGATIVASANPGCLAHLGASLAARDISVRHPIDLLADALP